VTRTRPIGEVLAAEGTRLRAMLARYAGILGWVLKDSAWRYKGAVVTALVGDFLGVTFQVTAIGQALYYAKALSEDKTIGALGYSFEARSSVGLLVLFGVGILTALTISALMIYYSQTKILKLWRDHADFCARRVFYLVQRGQRLMRPEDETYRTQQDILRMANKDAKFCAFALRMCLHVAVPLVTFLIALGTLVYLNLGLSLILGVLVVVALPFLYKASTYGALSSTRFEEYGQRARKEFATLLRRLKGVSVPKHSDGRWVRAPLESNLNRRYHDAFAGRVVASQRSALAVNLVLGVAVAVILLFFGYRAMQSGSHWGVVLTYLVAARYCVTNLRTVSIQLTNLNRFYPHLRRYRDFVASIEAAPEPAAEMPDAWTLRAPHPVVPESRTQAPFRAGDRVHLFGPIRLNRYSVPFVLSRLLSPSLEDMDGLVAATWFVGHRYASPPVSVREFLHLAEGEGLANLDADPDLRDALMDALPEDLDRPVPEEAWQDLEEGLAYSLALLAGRRSGCRWLLLDAQGLAEVSEPRRRRLLEGLADRFVVIVSATDTERLGCFGEDLVAVTDGTALVGLGDLDWAQAHREDLAEHLQAIEVARPEAWGEETADIEEEAGLDAEM